MPIFFLILAVVAVSTSAPLVRAADPAPALAVAALRVSVAAVLLAMLSGRQLAVLPRLERRDFRLIVFAGVLLGAHFGVWITSLYLTSTAASVALVAMQPVFAAAIGLLFLGDRVGRRDWLSIAVASAGCVVLAAGDLQAGGARVLSGDLLALAGAATAAGYLALGRRLRQALPLTPYLAAVNAVAAVTLLGAALASGTTLLSYDWSVYVAILACALVPSVIGHSLLNYCVRRVPVHVVALAILGEPIGASLISWWAYGEVPPLHAVFGGVMIVAGIAVGVAPRELRRSAG